MIRIMGISYISDKEASHRYGHSVAWFKKRRCDKKPPTFIKIEGKGKVYYPLEEIEKWFKQNMKIFY